MPSSARARAERFRELHHGATPLLLPGAWDVASARLFEELGFPAVSTSSLGLLASLGYPDGEEIGRAGLVKVIARIAAALAVPLSADIVSGFGSSPREVVRTVRAVVRAGAIGVNVEDVQHASHRLYPLERQLERLRPLVRLRDEGEVPFLLNARTDAFRRAPGEESERLQEAIRRATAFRDLGADCVFPMGLTEAGSIERFVRELDCPVNVMVRRGLPSVPELGRLGVARVSFGPTASYAALGFLRRAIRELRTTGTYDALLHDAISFEELGALAVRAPPPARRRARR